MQHKFLFENVSNNMTHQGYQVLIKKQLWNDKVNGWVCDVIVIVKFYSLKRHFST